jgi:3-phosphoinositide dependent protein kinase-1
VCRYCKFALLILNLLTRLKRDKHITFEQPPSPPPEPNGTAILADEWLESLSTARDMALTQHSLTGVGSYSGDSNMDISGTSQLPSPNDSIGLDMDGTLDGIDIPNGSQHGIMHGSRFRDGDEPRDAMGSDNGQKKGKKRFSRRQSKGGLAAVF